MCSGERLTPADTVALPLDVAKAISLRGWEVCEAMLMGRKNIENRRICLSGWIALHISRKPIHQDMEQMLRRVIPDLPACSLPGGHIVGLAHIEHCVDLQTLRSESGCSDDCDVSVGGQHTSGCTLSPFAHGPKCNFISAVIRLSSPVECKGNLGSWALPAAVRAQVVDQLKHTCKLMHQRVPRSWPRPGLQGATPSLERLVEPASCNTCGSLKTSKKYETGVNKGQYRWLRGKCNKCYQLSLL